MLLWGPHVAPKAARTHSLLRDNILFGASLGAAASVLPSMPRLRVPVANAARAAAAAAAAAALLAARGMEPVNKKPLPSEKPPLSASGRGEPTEEPAAAVAAAAPDRETERAAAARNAPGATRHAISQHPAARNQRHEGCMALNAAAAKPPPLVGHGSHGAPCWHHQLMLLPSLKTLVSPYVYPRPCGCVTALLLAVLSMVFCSAPCEWRRRMILGNGKLEPDGSQLNIRQTTVQMYTHRTE